MSSNMDCVNIRDANENDSSEVASLIQALNHFQHYYIDSPDEERLIKDGLGTNFHTLLAEINTEGNDGNKSKQVVGMITYSFAYFITLGQIVIMTGLFIKEKYRSKGIGKKLYDRVLKIAFEDNNCTAVAYFTKKDNTISVAFYKKLGSTDVFHDLDFLPFFHFNGSPIHKTGPGIQS